MFACQTFIHSKLHRVADTLTNIGLLQRATGAQLRYSTIVGDKDSATKVGFAEILEKQTFHQHKHLGDTLVFDVPSYLNCPQLESICLEPHREFKDNFEI